MATFAHCWKWYKQIEHLNKKNEFLFFQQSCSLNLLDLGLNWIRVGYATLTSFRSDTRHHSVPLTNTGSGNGSHHDEDRHGRQR